MIGRRRGVGVSRPTGSAEAGRDEEEATNIPSGASTVSSLMTIDGEDCRSWDLHSSSIGDKTSRLLSNASNRLNTGHCLR